MRSIDLLKKIILILLCACMLVASVGCGDEKDQNDIQKSEIPNSLDELEKGSELVITLADYLKQIDNSDINEPLLEDKINEIKNGARPLHINISPSCFYFVCAYYKVTEGKEKNHFLNASDCSWVRYESAQDIKEYYNGKTLGAAFQLNRSIFVVDILDGSIPPSAEYFQIYTPIFENGMNVADAADVDCERYIYFNSFDQHDVYFSSEDQYGSFVSLPCISIDSDEYVMLDLSRYDINEMNHDASINFDDALRHEFGEYYEAFSSIIDTEIYNKIDGQENKHSYGIFKFEDFSREISKAVSKQRLISQMMKDFDTVGETVEFNVHFYVHIELAHDSGFQRFNIKALNDDIYINEILFDGVEIINEPVYSNEDDFYNGAPQNEITANNEHFKEKREILKKILNAESCFSLTNTDLNARYDIYIIDDNYYCLLVYGDEAQYVYRYMLEE